MQIGKKHGSKIKGKSMIQINSTEIIDIGNSS